MYLSRFSLVRLQAVLVALLAAAASGAQVTAPNSPDISFTVLMSKPSTHLLEVEMRLQRSNGASHTDLVMQVWTPGSYLIREFERHVQDFAAEADGRALDWMKADNDTWRVKTSGA